MAAMIRPDLLPKVRDQILRHLDDPDSAINQTLFARDMGASLAAGLREAWLGWATADMAALAMHAGEDLPYSDWSEQVRPAPVGLLAFDGGIGALNLYGDDRLGDFARASGVAAMPVDAVSWRSDVTIEGEPVCVVTFWLARTRVQDLVARQGKVLLSEQVPPLLPICHSGMPVVAGGVPVDDRGLGVVEGMPGYLTRGWADDLALTWPVLRAVNAAWALMQQQSLVEDTPVDVDRKLRKAYARQDRPRPEVRMVDVRRRYRVDQQTAAAAGPGDTARRKAGNWRFIVRGHWRNQACGPGRQERSRIWIADHWRGDADAPLLATTKVNVWRR